MQGESGPGEAQQTSALEATVAAITPWPRCAQLRYFLAALSYFTRVPVARKVSFDAGDLAAAIRYFPLIGLFVGGLSALVYWGALHLFPVSIAVLASLATSVVLTGALHEDGLADCCDAFGGAMRREDVLRIMRDSRIGVFGALALLLVFASKWQALAALPPARAAWAMVAAHAASRALTVSFLLSLDYARPHGPAKARPLAQRISLPVFGGAALLGLPWLFWPDWRVGCVALTVLIALRFLLSRYFARRIGGYTGDCLGFSQQLFELSIYLVWISF